MMAPGVTGPAPTPLSVDPFSHLKGKSHAHSALAHRYSDSADPADPAVALTSARSEIPRSPSGGFSVCPDPVTNRNITEVCFLYREPKSKFNSQRHGATMAKKPKLLSDLFHDTLKDVYFAENKILKTLPKMAKAAQSKELKAAFVKHERRPAGRSSACRTSSKFWASRRGPRPVRPSWESPRKARRS